MIYPPETRTAVLAAVREIQMILPVARAWHISPLTVTRWAQQAKIALPSALDRQRRGAQEAPHRRWPGYEKRRKRAQAMRLRGATLAEIAAAVGLSIAGAHYASRPREV